MAVHLRHDSVVPPLRPDLNLLSPPTGTGAEVIDIHPLDSPDTMPMHGFELSIALMLDGKRTADEVIVACARLGLPLNLASLEGFVQQLDAHRLLGSGAFPVRRTRPGWSPQVRELFRSALRSAREGDRATARVQIQRILELAPATPEARRFRDWLDAHEDEDFQHAFADAIEHWAPPPQPSAWQGLLEQLAQDPWLAATLVGIVVLLALAALVPLPRVTAAHAQLLPANQVTVFAPDEGVVGPVVVHDGDPVKAGALLFSWSADDLQLRLLDASEALEAARRPLRDRANKIPEAASVLARLRVGETELARAQTTLLRDQKEFAGGDLAQPTVESEARFALAWQEVQTAQAGLDVMAQPGTLEALRLNALSGAVRMLRERLLHRAVVAQTDGVVSGLTVHPGEQVFEGQGLMRLDDRGHLRVVAQVTPQQAQTFRAGEPIEIAFEHVRKPAVVEGVFGYEVVAEVDNADAALEPGTEQVHLERPARSLLQLMLR